jgi:hypothetical protein
MSWPLRLLFMYAWQLPTLKATRLSISNPTRYNVAYNHTLFGFCSMSCTARRTCSCATGQSPNAPQRRPTQPGRRRHIQATPGDARSGE